MYNITFFAPKDAVEAVKEALFAVGVGKIGNYDQCSFEVEGVGQFRALAGANPTIGKVGELEKIPEVRVEMVMEDAIIKIAIEALLKAHPYETPAYRVVKCIDMET